MKQSEKACRGRDIAWLVMMAVSVVICLSGILFCIYSIVFEISVPVFGFGVPGIIFGAILLGLGIRYIFRLYNMKHMEEVPKWGIHND